jgi:ATP-dependent DNA helicase RecQ
VYFIETAFPELREVMSAHAAYSRLGVWNADPEELRPLLPDAAWKSLDASRRLLQKVGALRSDGSVGPFDPSGLDLKELAALKQHAYTKLAQMIDYAQLRQCRHAFITDYFGEVTAERFCRSCDNCELGEVSEIAGAPLEPSIIRAALAGSARFAGRIGIVNLASILAGKENRFTRDQPWVLNVPAYGSLSGWTQGRARRLLEELVRLGYLAQTLGQYPMVELNDRGRAVLSGTETISVTIAPDPQPAPGPAADPELFQRLRQWRAEVARRQGVPAYVVFHDRTLTELAARRPADMVALEALPGIGRSKLDRYGTALLEIIASPIH